VIGENDVGLEALILIFQSITNLVTTNGIPIWNLKENAIFTLIINVFIKNRLK